MSYDWIWNEHNNGTWKTRILLCLFFVDAKQAKVRLHATRSLRLVHVRISWEENENVKKEQITGSLSPSLSLSYAQSAGRSYARLLSLALSLSLSLPLHFFHSSCAFAKHTNNCSNWKERDKKEKEKEWRKEKKKNNNNGLVCVCVCVHTHECIEHHRCLEHATRTGNRKKKQQYWRLASRERQIRITTTITDA